MSFAISKIIRSFMTFPELDKMNELKMVVFTDAFLGNINEGTGSAGAFIICLISVCPLLFFKWLIVL